MSLEYNKNNIKHFKVLIKIFGNPYKSMDEKIHSSLHTETLKRRY